MHVIKVMVFVPCSSCKKWMKISLISEIEAIMLFVGHYTPSHRLTILTKQFKPNGELLMEFIKFKQISLVNFTIEVYLGGIHM